MLEQLNIYIDRLKEGMSYPIQEELPPDFLEVSEKDLSFPQPVHLSGETYLTDGHLVLHLKIHTVALIPCSICNNPTSVPVVVKDFTLAESLAEIQSIFNYTDPLREAIVLQTPPFVECHQGACPERATISKFLKKGSSPQQYPFAGLEK